MPRAARTFPPFDPIAHALIDLPNSRRGFVRTLAMGVIGALGFGGEAADAACSRSCGACKRCKAGHCRPKPDGTACPAGVCKHGRCVCPGAKPAHCGGICVDLGSDPENCGSCGQACAADEGCDAEGCCLALGTTCQAGQGRCCRGLVCCDGQCRDLSTDAAHCGVCEGGRAATLPSARMAPASVPVARPAQRTV